MAFEAYHGVTGAEHQTRFNRLGRPGYRMISLSVHGEPGNPRYSAVWVQRGGSGLGRRPRRRRRRLPAVVQHVDGDAATRRCSCPRPGTAQKAVFAAVMEQGVAGHWEARHGLTSGPDTNPGTFEYQNKAARAAGLIPRSVAIYGTAVDAPLRRRLARQSRLHEVARPCVRHGGELSDRVRRRDAMPGFGVHGWRPESSPSPATASTARCSSDDVVGPWCAATG